MARAISTLGRVDLLDRMGRNEIESFPIHFVHSWQSLVVLVLFNALHFQILSPDGEPVNPLQNKTVANGKHVTVDTTV